MICDQEKMYVKRYFFNQMMKLKKVFQGKNILTNKK